METNWLACIVSPGQFPSEYAISGVQHNGDAFSLFAPRETVVAAAIDGPGYVQVDIVDRRGDLVLVRLPAQTFENGQYVTVKAQELTTTPPNQRVGA